MTIYASVHYRGRAKPTPVVEIPKVLAYTTAGWASACGFKTQHPKSRILRGAGSSGMPTLFIVNEAFFGAVAG